MTSQGVDQLFFVHLASAFNANLFGLLIQLTLRSVLIGFRLPALMARVGRIGNARGFGLTHPFVSKVFILFVVFNLGSVILCHDSMGDMRKGFSQEMQRFDVA